LLEFRDTFHDLGNFYEHQRSTWERLRAAYAKFKLNQLELERDGEAGAAMQRMDEILSARSPYALIKDTENLIKVVSQVNDALLAERRRKALVKIADQIAAVLKDVSSAGADDGLKMACLRPLEDLRKQIETQDSLAHISQAESEVIRCKDAALAKIDDFLAK